MPRTMVSPAATARRPVGNESGRLLATGGLMVTMITTAFLMMVVWAEVGHDYQASRPIPPEPRRPVSGSRSGRGLPEHPESRRRIKPDKAADSARGDNSSTQETKDCGPGWEYIVRACYSFVVDQQLSWDDALLHCQGTGGQLLSVSDMAEKNRMSKRLKRLGARGETWWIGLHKDRASRQWQWLDRGDFNPRLTKWNRGGTYGNRHKCADFNSKGQINDKNCQDNLSFVCERHEITPRPVDMTTQPITTTSTTTPITSTTTTQPPTTPTPTSTTPTTSLPKTTTTESVPTTTESTTTTTTTTITPSTTTTTEMTSTTTEAMSSSTTSPSILTSPVIVDEDNDDEGDKDAEEEEITVVTTEVLTIPATTTTPPPPPPPPKTTTPATTSTTEAKTTTPTTTTATTTEETTTRARTTPPPPPPTTTTTATTTTTMRATTTEMDMFTIYSGCYMLESRGRRHGRSDPFLYALGARTCPEVTASRVTWPETHHNLTKTMACKNGQGEMQFYCGGSPTCWRGAPNVDQCASPRFRKILNTVLTKMTHPENITEAAEAEETVELTTELADVTKGDDVTEEDIVATSKVLESLVTSGAAANVKDEEDVKDIVVNVVRVGSNLVSSNKSQVWGDMAEQDKIRSATSLLVAMETATIAMAEEMNEPTTIVTKDENIELQLRVVNVSAMAMEEGEEEEIVYQAEDSDSQFSIPMETLSHLSQGGLAKVVFMTHYSMGDILNESYNDDDSNDDHDGDAEWPDAAEDPADVGRKEEEREKRAAAPKLASYILSASVGGSEHQQGPVKLPQPISFTMRHLKNIPEGYHSLCSFWSISESGMGEWSQEGCRVAHSNASQTTCECDHMTNFAVLMAPQAVELSEMHESLLRLVTIVGCIISCLCLLASWVTFTCFTTLQGERNSIHKNLVACLFIAELLFLTGIDQTQNRLACGIIAGCLQYVFLAAFLWMMLEGVHIVLMLVQVFDASRSRLPYYYATAYAPPILIIAVSAGLYHQGYGTDKYCWLTTDRYFIWSFAGPVAAILLANTVILIYAMTMVYRHSEYVFGGKDKTTASGVRSWIQGAMAMEVLLGLTWMLGFFFLDMQTVAVAYVFTVLNTLQGLFIFLFHCVFNKKTRKEYQRVMKVKRRPSTTTGSGSGTHSSTARNKLTSGPSFNKHSHYMDAPTYHYFGGRA